MRRHVPAVVTFFAGLAAGLSVAIPRPSRTEAAPPPAYAEEIMISRLEPPQAEVLVLRPYAVTVDGRTENIGARPPEPARWLVSYGSGHVTIACELVGRR